MDELERILNQLKGKKLQWSIRGSESFSHSVTGEIKNYYYDRTLNTCFIKLKGSGKHHFTVSGPITVKMDRNDDKCLIYNVYSRNRSLFLSFGYKKNDFFK